ncbi:hypothetical protein A2U01_0063530, partial [Trifolium medium]|nr:hypothetical protein [Trifolium medium]
MYPFEEIRFEDCIWTSSEDIICEYNARLEEGEGFDQLSNYYYTELINMDLSLGGLNERVIEMKKKVSVFGSSHLQE